MGWITEERLASIIQRTRDGGAEIVGLLKDAVSALFTHPPPRRSKWPRAYLKDEKPRLLPVAAYVDGTLWALRIFMFGVAGGDRPRVVGAHRRTGNLLYRTKKPRVG